MHPHSALIRVTHWITTLSFFALLVSGVELVISHPRFYWGEEGNVNTPALFQLPIPASRGSVPTGYNYVLKDQNGWSRSLHFQTAWAIVITGLIYLIYALRTRHFRKQAAIYNPLQHRTYLAVVFGLLPLLIWTGLAMSPAFASAFPFTVEICGGQQSARTIHFFATLLLVLFFFVHTAKVSTTGFKAHMRAMTIGTKTKEQA
ncbi:MAG: cytochrome b/b6 domain-containing protein [Acidobacteria bacterium]|nr:cytochrome b/b6 domain-containing protein [Acidobacteriota bacterium]